MSHDNEEPRLEEAQYAFKLLFRGRQHSVPAFHRLSAAMVSALVDADLTHEGEGWRAIEVALFMKSYPLTPFDRKLMEMALALVSLE